MYVYVLYGIINFVRNDHNIIIQLIFVYFFRIIYYCKPKCSIIIPIDEYGDLNPRDNFRVTDYFN